jgi:EAL domain-containing protein (putative c-di-GMP-specific phosphodiesterase class I)/ActR/RegA family two-component response regulator
MNQAINDMSILLIDDDPFYSQLAVEVLNNLGFEAVSVANDGTTGLDCLTKENLHFDVVICDLNMPEMNGVEFIRHASKTGFDGGIILLSGENKRMLETAYGVAKTHDANILGAMAKPINPDELRETMGRMQPSGDNKRSFTPQEPITEAQLRDGIEGSANDEVLLVFQPKIEVASGKIVGVETLARWWNKDRGVLGPGAFIPLAEEKALIDDLTNTIYRKAVQQAADWQRQNVDLRAAINFSVNSFSRQEFCDFLINTVKDFNIDPDRLLLEITETQAMSIAVNCLESIIGMRLNRFGLSIDDFGTGNSSLAQLKNIPFTELKVDRAFVTGAATNESALAILEASISLARKLEMVVVAEGVETRQDWDLVENLGVDFVQGFYCARPMSNSDLMVFMDSWTGPHNQE